MSFTTTTTIGRVQRRAPLALAALLLCAASGSAATRQVPGGYPTLAAAVAAADIGDTIQISQGVFFSNQVFTKSVTLVGAGLDRTTLDGGKSGTILTTTPGVTLTVRDLTLRSGKATNALGLGGGILNDGDLRMERCEIRDCSAPAAGGALSNVNGNARLVDCYIHDNEATLAGGAIDNNAALTLENCTIADNETDSGGAIMNTGQLDMTNCTLFRNMANHGGGMYLHSGTATVRYSTLVQNGALDGAGGGVLSLKTFTARGSIIALNKAEVSGEDVRGELDSSGYNLIGNNDGATIVALGGSGPDQVGTPAARLDPRLAGTPGENGGATRTLMPASNSPAIDKGGADGFPDWDQRGAHRPRDGGSGSLLADAGAVEVGPVGYAVQDLRRALQLAAGLATANAADAWLNVDSNGAGVDLNDCAHIARKAVGL